MMPRARLVCPALRWRRGSFKSEREKIEQALAAGVGGFILFGGTRAAVATLTSALRDTAGRPLLLGSDFERGPGQQVRGLTELPPPAALGYLNDLDATYACGQITGTEARAVGLTWVFAPVCDLDIEPKNPIVQTRSFGADPQLVSTHAAAWIRGCQEHFVMACAKHFPGHGRTTTDSHEGLPVVEALGDELQQMDVAPFKAAGGAGVGRGMRGRRGGRIAWRRRGRGTRRRGGGGGGGGGGGTREGWMIPSSPSIRSSRTGWRIGRCMWCAVRNRSSAKPSA